MKPSLPHRSAAPLLSCAALLLVGAASPPIPFLPGEWTFTNVPGAASLNGRPLHDLPVGEATSETACLTPAQAKEPARWLARDIAGDCTMVRGTVAAGRIDIVGRCAPRDDGQPAGTLTIAGRYGADRYDLHFTTVAHGDNGVMSFDGTMSGRRTGTCRSDRPQG